MEYFENEEAVCVNNCEIKRSRYMDKLEVLLKKGTEVVKADKVINIDHNQNEANQNDSDIVVLANIRDLPLFKRVTVTVKAVFVSEPVEIKGGRRKQDVVIADPTGRCRLTVWEEQIGKVKEQHCYSMQGLMIREFQGKKMLTTSKEDCTINKIEDTSCIQDIDDNNNTDELSTGLIKQTVKVIAVNKIDHYLSCFKCGGKVTIDEDDDDINFVSVKSAKYIKTKTNVKIQYKQC